VSTHAAPVELQDRVRTAAQWLRAHARAGADLRIDSRQVDPGDIFVAVPGRRTDGARFVEQALARGAAAILVDDPGGPTAAGPSRPAAIPAPVPVLPVPGLGAALAWIAADFYGDPSARLRTVGITGTNGKTSSCQWIGQLLGACGQRCATLGTLGFGFPDALDASATDLTTPDAASVQRLARAACDAGASALAMEVSSVGLDQGRVDGVAFAVALFTNLTRDHLDYHHDMDAYGAAKRRLFGWPTLSHAVLNLDDAFGVRLARELQGRAARSGLGIIGVGTTADPVPDLELACRLRARAIEPRAGGMRFEVLCERGRGAEPVTVETALVGDFNVLNLLGVLGVAMACGVALDAAAQAMAGLRAPAGRLQRVADDAIAASGAQLPVAVVDYAHTPDAIAKALQTLRPLARANGGRLWIVFGAGGDRDRGKRPAMAAAAAAAADALVLTSDNPRNEDAEAILDDLAAGVPAGRYCERIADRAQAIDHTLRAARPGDVVLIAGKGHEDYQEIAGRRLPFSDVASALAALRARAGGAAC
jgi:UDP-N-acetylmuramyl-tripeptide synthetase